MLKIMTITNYYESHKEGKLDNQNYKDAFVLF